MSYFAFIIFQSQGLIFTLMLATRLIGSDWNGFYSLANTYKKYVSITGISDFREEPGAVSFYIITNFCYIIISMLIIGYTLIRIRKKK